MNRIGKVLVLAFVLIASTCFSAQWNVTVTEFEFLPPDLTISMGDTVIWTNVLGIHNVLEACGDPLFVNSVQEAPWVYQFVFTAANGVVAGAVYPYLCEVHPDLMWGKITVTRPPARWDVTVTNFSFTPQVLNVVTGDTIVWSRVAGTHNVHHNVAVPKFHNTIGGTWTTYVWPCSVGTSVLPYVCQVHSATMTGTVNVTGVPSPTPTPVAVVIQPNGLDAVLNWPSVPGATCYLIYKQATPEPSPFTTLISATSDTSFTHFGASAVNNKCFYEVRAINN